MKDTSYIGSPRGSVGADGHTHGLYLENENGGTRDYSPVHFTSILKMFRRRLAKISNVGFCEGHVSSDQS